MLILIVLTIILSNVIFSKKEKVILDEVSLLSEGSKGTSFAMYYETQQEGGTYTYVESEDTTWPTDLRYNDKKSGCIDYNGNKIDGTLTYNKENNKVTLRTKGATLCYLYFDLGTEEKPYKIQYIEDLVDLSNKVNKGETNEDAYFTLEKNLDFKQEESYRQYDRTDYGDINGVGGTEQLITELTNPEGTGFPPIGTGNTFDGNFNGQEFTLSNLYVNVTDKHAGLFGLVGIAGSTNTIKNLTITGSVNKKGTTGHASGIVASSSANSIIIDNVHNKVNVTIEGTTQYAAGILGYSENSAKFINSDNSGNISGGEVAAGIMAKTEGKGKIEVDTCNNTGNITTDNLDTGGLLGYLIGPYTIKNSNNRGTITGLKHMGGLIGSGGKPSTGPGEGIINGSHNYGEIVSSAPTTDGYIGGLVGSVPGSSKLEIYDSSNEGNIGNASGYIGGIAGFVDTLKMDNCSNTGALTEVNKNVGGLVGNLGNTTDDIGTISRSNNEGNIIAGNNGINVGGLVGNTGVTTTIEESHNYGQIKVEYNELLTSSKSIGGLVGLTQANVTIENSTNKANIIVESKTTSGEGASVGGIIGRKANPGTVGILTNNYNTGKIDVTETGTPETRVGGIVGWKSNGELTIDNNYNEGIINVNAKVSISTGGIVGDSCATSESILIINSYNTGEINSKNTDNYLNHVGGIVGRLINSNSSRIENSYNKGNINGGNRTGGIVGVVSGNSKVIINKCYNTGNLTGQEDTKYTSSVHVGGIISHTWSNSLSATSYILNSYNTGILTSKAPNTSNTVTGMGVVNDNESSPSTSVVLNSYNLGKIISIENGAGINSVSVISNLKINNVYNLGNLEAPTKYGILRSKTTIGTVDVKNAYYLSGINGSNVSSNGTNLSIDTKSMSESEIKSQSFVDVLNSNINNIDLGSIDSDLKDYTLVDWVIDSNTGYPTLNYNLESN